MSLLHELSSLPGAEEVLRHARAERPQKNELCGAFAGLVSLRAHGVEVTDQDEVALAAGTVLASGDEPSWPPGECGRADFRLTLPVAGGSASAGTSAIGLARAIETLSHGELAAVPASGEWTVPALGRLLDGARRLGRVVVIANVDTGKFAAHDTPQRLLRDYLDAGEIPLWTSRWRVGHFVLVAGMSTGTAGTLVSVVDTYPSLGEQGVHLQPIENLAAALRRKGMAPGGMLLIVRADWAGAARALVTDAGLRAQLWDNGSPAPRGQSR
ncbi:hypothetical protein ABZ863_23165 [Saccharomonospora sp. NPDC046836]|uniref:DUF6885 family protein n=1 Tax=Saccharomonospora sp. NPDC046836 TaxID=3156921 RepID=UPI0033DCF7B7